MTDPHSTPPRPSQPNTETPEAPQKAVPPTAPSGSDATKPVPAEHAAPPGLESVTGTPGYSARHASSAETPSTPGLGRPSSGQGESDQAKSDQAKGAAQDVAGDAKDAGQAVKDTAAHEAAGVKDDAVREAKRLGDEAGTMLESQAGEQLDRAATTVRTFSDDIARLARGEKPEPGVAQDLLEQLNSRADATATWLEHHDPKEVLQEVQGFARRRPVAFLAIAAGVGFAAGRLTRGVQQNHTDDADTAGSQRTSGSQPTSGAAGSGTATSGTAGSGTAGAGSAPTAPAPVSGNQTAGAPAYETGPATPTPGYTGGTDPYAGGAGR